MNYLIRMLLIRSDKWPARSLITAYSSRSLTMYIMLTRTFRKELFLNCDTRQRIRHNET